MTSCRRHGISLLVLLSVLVALLAAVWAQVQPGFQAHTAKIQEFIRQFSDPYDSAVES
jgi:hypothetical protein